MLIVFVRIIDQRECTDNSGMKPFLFHYIILQKHDMVFRSALLRTYSVVNVSKSGSLESRQEEI